MVNTAGRRSCPRAGAAKAIVKSAFDEGTIVVRSCGDLQCSAGSARAAVPLPSQVAEAATADQDSKGHTLPVEAAEAA